MITVFECPFRADCHEEKVVSWIENEPIEITFPRKSRGFLGMHRASVGLRLGREKKT